LVRSAGKEQATLVGHRRHGTYRDDSASDFTCDLILANNNFVLWIVVLCANMPVLALNLAAQPPKITIPVMLTSLFVNIVVIVISGAMFLMVQSA